jgi:hypothetical protein
VPSCWDWHNLDFLAESEIFGAFPGSRGFEQQGDRTITCFTCLNTAFDF